MSQQRRKLNVELIGYMNIFAKITRTNVKDCFVDNNGLLTFIVNELDIGKAVGKKASNVRTIENRLKKRIKIVGYSENLLTFIKNIIYPLAVREIIEEEGVVSITPNDSKTKSLLIGRNAQNLRNTETIVKRYFSINEIKVI